MKKTKFLLVISAVLFFIIGFFVKGIGEKRDGFTAAYFQTAGYYFTVFQGAVGSALVTENTLVPAKLNTGTVSHQLYATKGTSKPLYWN